eukprot:501447_1
MSTLILVLLAFMQRNSAWTQGFICATAVQITSKNEWGTHELEIFPGERQKGDKCYTSKGTRKNLKISDGWGNLAKCICYPFQGGSYGPCIKVTELDNHILDRNDETGTTFINPSDHNGFDIGEEFTVEVQLRKKRNGKNDGKVQVRMHKYPCINKSCRCYNGVPTPRPTPSPTWPTPKPRPTARPTPRPTWPTPRPAINPNCLKRRLLREPRWPC